MAVKMMDSANSKMSVLGFIINSIVDSYSKDRGLLLKTEFFLELDQVHEYIFNIRLNIVKMEHGTTKTTTRLSTAMPIMNGINPNKK